MLFQLEPSVFYTSLIIVLAMCVFQSIFAAIFLKRYMGLERGSLQRVTYLCFALFFLFRAASRIFGFIFNFVTTQFNPDLFIENGLYFRIGNSTMLFGFAFGVYIIEKNIFKGKTKNFFTGWTCFFAFWITFLSQLETLDRFNGMLLFTYIGIGLPAIVMGIAYIYLGLKIPGKDYKKYCFIVSTGLIMLLILPIFAFFIGEGQYMMAGDSEEFYRVFVYFLNNLMNLASSVLVAYGMLNLHSKK